ncbi:MAG: Hsp70 family protein, partial [Pirellulales bacterium]|nr:Hsp70 family protein [Pirellulales bacterium]
CFPSVVEFDEKGEFVHVGLYALRSLPVYPKTVVIAAKRLIGKAFQSAKAAGDIDRFSYTILKDPDGGCAIQVGPREYTPTEITALILKKIKKDAEADFNPIGNTITEAVITVPAYFDPIQKSETERAGLEAGFERVSLIPEPTAAASAYRIEVEQEDQYIMVIDLGAGTLDVTVALLFLDDNGKLQTEEKGHGGDTALGGLDMDDAILNYVVKHYRLHKNLSDTRMRSRLRMELERAKIQLSSQEVSEVAFPTTGGDIRFQITRKEIESAVQPIIDRCRGPIRVALNEAGLAPEDLSHVLLVGGPTMMPAVQRMVMEEMKANARVVQELREIDTKGFPVHPMEAVARGAVMGAVSRIMPHGYGILWGGEYQELFPRRARYPDNGIMGFQFSGKERSIHFSLVRCAVDPQTRLEEYMLLGVYSFDIFTQPGGIEFQIEWECTENGSLDFRMVQYSTGIELPLYDVTKLQGEKIRKPARKIWSPEPYPKMKPSIQPDLFRPPQQRQPEVWRPHEMEQAIQLGQKLLTLAEERFAELPSAQQEKIRDVIAQLSRCVLSSQEDPNLRTPRIRNLNRALINLLKVNRLMTGKELYSLTSEDF